LSYNETRHAVGLGVPTLVERADVPRHRVLVSLYWAMAASSLDQTADRAAANTSTPSVPQLIQNFRSGNEDARIEAGRELLARTADPRATAALDEALQSEDDNTYDAVRNAIEDAGGAAIPYLQILLRKGGVLRGATLDILDEWGPRASAAVPDLMRLLDQGTQEDKDAVEGTLAAIGDAAVEPLAAEVSGHSPLRAAAIRTLARMPAEARGLRNEERLLGLLLQELRSPCDETCAYAVKGLGDLGATAAPAWPRLKPLLDPQTNPEWALAAEAVGKIGAHADEALPILRKLLAMSPERGGAEVATAIGKFGSRAKAAVPDLEGLLGSRVDSTVQYAAEALGEIGPDATPATRALEAVLSRPDSETRRYAAGALDRIADALPAVAAEYDDKKAQELVDEFGAALEKVKQDPQIDDYPNQHGSTVPTLERGIRYLRELQQSRRNSRLERIAWRAAILAGLISLGTVALLTVRIRWAILALLGRRWSFVTGTCTVTAQLDLDGLVVRTTRDATATAVRMRLGSCAEDQAATKAVRELLPEASTLLLVADVKSFRTPWAHAFGSGWSQGEKAVVAGQICVAASLQFLRARELRLQFRALGCEKAPGLEPLSAVMDELELVSRQFRRWGAAVSGVNPNASKADVAAALCEADAVHVAAHANGSGIHLADGTFDIAAFAAQVGTKLRCRILVLSGCEAGQIGDDHALVYQLVQGGSTVIASLSPVRDSTCLLLFDALYRSLLPHRQAQGIELAAAIRHAGAECAQRLEKVERTLALKAAGPAHWRRSLDAFILYGDPSVRLTLLRAGT
jgi:HEAT repeat protein